MEQAELTYSTKRIIDIIEQMLQAPRLTAEDHRNLRSARTFASSFAHALNLQEVEREDFDAVAKRVIWQTCQQDSQPGLWARKIEERVALEKSFIEQGF